jgi:hypothetical protein
LIADADQRVYFDGNSKLYDKSDAKWAFVLTADSREAFEEEYEGKASDWPDQKLRATFDWFAPDIVVKAEYYEVEEKNEKLLVFTQILTEDEERWWEDELDAAEKAELKARGLENGDQGASPQASAQIHHVRCRSAGGSRPHRRSEYPDCPGVRKALVRR